MLADRRPSVRNPPSDKSTPDPQRPVLTPHEIVEIIDGLIDVYGDWFQARDSVLESLAIHLGPQIHRNAVRDRLLAFFGKLGTVRMTQERIADCVGASRETVTRELKRLIESGLVIRTWHYREGRSLEKPGSSYRLRREDES